MQTYSYRYSSWCIFFRFSHQNIHLFLTSLVLVTFHAHSVQLYANNNNKSRASFEPRTALCRQRLICEDLTLSGRYYHGEVLLRSSKQFREFFQLDRKSFLYQVSRCLICFSGIVILLEFSTLNMCGTDKIYW